ncbi:hypothetical protein Cni_G27483 [Canna indica]|uniref:F-box domain-containing protein n=1 Tax=Canna indica TaxID=4628 RepID=A0AAQ3L5P9_9LILI|nr:hypothetical protein Cni_G27483 [Canna indica]
MADACNSRSLSWLVKPCRPDPRREIVAHQHPSLDITHPQHLRPSASPVAPIASLPDDILLECLSRVPPSSLPALSLVCRRFSLLLDSPAFLRLRRSHGRLRRTLHALALSDLGVLSSASLPVDSSLAAAVADAWAPPASSSSAFAVAPLDALDGSFSFSHARIAAVGRSIYIIGRGATLRYDTWTGAVAARAPTIFPRKKFAAAAIGGKIYVAGGAARTSAVEEYDPVTDAWRVVADAPRQRYGCIGAAAGGVFYIAGGLRVGGGGGEGGRLDAHVCAGSMDAYHVEAGAWVRGRPGAGAAVLPGGGCVVGACGAGPHVYVVASHAVELSFWRWEGRARRSGGGGGEWTRLEPPPIPARAGLGGAVRFSCVGVGEKKVVALVHVSFGCGNGGGGGGRRSSEVAALEGAVLVYDIRGGEWTRGPDLPPGFRRFAVACVEF